MIGSKQLRRIDRGLIRRAAFWNPPWARWVRAALETASEHTRLWWAAAALMAAAGGPTGRKAAVAGLTGMGLAELVSNEVCKRLYHRRRPPEHLVPCVDARERPDGSSFPSGHTAAAVGFTTAVAGVSPRLGAACAVPATMVALERVHAGTHYPSDVAAGAAVGAASAWLVHRTPCLPQAPRGTAARRLFSARGRGTRR